VTTLSSVPAGVRAIYFDAVGTLLHPEPPAAAVYALAGQRFGSRLDPATIATRFRAAFRRQEDRDHAHGLRTDEEREVERWRAIVGEVLDDVTDAAACFQELYDHFACPESWRCDAEAEATLLRLAEQGYQLGLASNFDRRLHGVVAGLAALRLVRHLVISSEVGWRKPAAGFFQSMCRLSALRPSQILLVGDDAGNDYEGARAAGLHALLFDPRGKEPIPGDGRITRLSDLLAGHDR
jgi:putative hydrolase of the HAD superfamily